MSLCGARTDSTVARSEIKTITQNDLRDQVVGRARQSDAEAEIDLPLRGDD